MTKEQVLSNYNPIPYIGCWIWDGNLLNGYGTIFHEGKTQKAHRMLYEAHKGAIPKGMLVCHKCDEPSCVNPDHLFIGSQKENMEDCVAKGRIAKGSRQGNAKLTEDQVIEIRRMFAEGAKLREVAKLYNMSTQNASDIKTRNSWRWLK